MAYYKDSMKLKTFLIVIILMFHAVELKRRSALSEQTQTKQEKDTVVEANHFYSKKELGTNYDINDVEVNKSLIFILKPHSKQATDKSLQDNPITIKIKSGSQQTNCIFNRYGNLCAIKEVKQNKMNLHLECKSLPCELSWIILQPSILSNDSYHNLQTLVEVNQDKNHAILHVSCNNPDFKDTFADKLKLYTNSNFTQYSTKQGMAFFTFSNQQKGFYYLTSEDEGIRKCANASLKHMSDSIQMNSKQQFSDYLVKGQTNNYEINKIPDTDFRLEAELHDIQLQQLVSTAGVKTTLVGFNGNDKKVITQFVLTIDDDKKFMQFNIVFKKVTQKFDRLQVQLQAIDANLMLNARFISANLHQIQIDQQSFFDLKKGQKIEYKLIALPKEQTNIKKMYIFSDDTKFTLSKKQCQRDGCQFTLTANQDGKSKIFVGSNQKQTKSQIITQTFERTITKKAYQGQQLRFSHKIQANKNVQLLVNSPSIVVYAGSKQKCPEFVDDKCKQTSFNHNFPTIYQPKKDGELMFKVIALDNCQFTLTVLNEDSAYIQLKDTQPFAYLFDDKQTQLTFSFKLDKKSPVSFNLISPLNQLTLSVLNEKDDSNGWDAAQTSTQGFIQFPQKQLNGLNFVIKVNKRQQYKQKYIHFTLIVATRQGNLRLQAGLPHYETLLPKDTRDYVFQFNPKSETQLNFYTHNIKQNVQINLKVSSADQYNDTSKTAQFTIDSQIDTLDLKLVSQKLCTKLEGENCEIFVRVKNLMDVEADVTFTLIQKDSIIELKDGIWQSYDINAASATSHFYFMPKNINHSATIYYKPSVVDLKILYTIWHSDDLSIQPSKWPFPQDPFRQYQEGDKKVTNSNQPHRLAFKPLQYIHIQPSQLKQCWPNCVVLMSLAADPQLIQDALKTNMTNLINAHFRIMGTNNLLQLPEKHKVDVLLNKDQTKEMLVDLKYHLDKPSVVIRNHHTLGVSKLTANVYSQKNPRCPSPDDDADFKLQKSQTVISVDDIKAKLKDNQMEEDGAYLCILAKASQSSKFNIQFTSDQEGLAHLSIDTTTTLKSASKVQLYQMDYSQQSYIKITRNQGFPYIRHKLCKPQQQKCVQQFVQGKEKGLQLADKVGTISETPCPRCQLLLRVQTLQQTQIIIHLQSKYTQLQLVENQLINDAVQKQQQNRYTLTGTKEQEILLNIQIISGDLKVQVHDFEQISISKSNTPGSKNIHITIPPKGITSKDIKTDSKSSSSALALSHFLHLHITVRSQDITKSAVYTITYSSGDPVVYLQDGLILQYNLQPKKVTKFIYNNPANQQIFLYTSTASADNLKKIQKKYYAIDNGDQDSQISITPQKSQFQKKTANPTEFVKIPAKQHYIFSLNNKDDKPIIFSIGINNRQIIYLPYDHELPIQLQNNQTLYLMINAASEGWVRLSFSKCANGMPYIGYTLDYHEFVTQDYSIQEQMTQDMYSELVIKVKSQSAIYLRLRSPQDDGTLMAVKAVFSPTKIDAARSKPGQKGQINYQLLDSTKAELTFTSLVCAPGHKNCQKDFNYQVLTSSSIDSVYAHLVCPSIMFDLPYMQKLHTANTTKIKTTTGNKITFSQPITNQIQYVGVRAVNTKTGEIVYYNPIQIVTFWGQLHRSSPSTLFLGIILMLVVICSCLMIFRRYQKTQGYQTLNPINDNID